MNVALYIARRLSLKRDSEISGGELQRRSPAITIATAGIALSVAIMIVTLAIVPGFKHQITEKVMGFDAQITLQPSQVSEAVLDGTTYGIDAGDRLMSMIDKELPEGAHVGVSIKQPGILKTDDQFAGLVFKGYDKARLYDFVAENLEEGLMPDYSSDSTRYDIVISRVTSDMLGLKTGDTVNGYFFANNSLRARKFKIAGIYNTHFSEYDKLLAFASISALTTLSGLSDGQGTAIEITGLQEGEIEPVAALMRRVATDAFYSDATNCYLRVTDVYRQDPMYFNWLELLDTNVIVILVLMGCVAAVTLVSCLFIMILERVKLIGTLKSLGADNRLVARIFLYMGERIVLRGILWGNALGLLIVWLQWQFNIIPLDPEAYYLSSVPVEFNWPAIIVFNLAVVIVSMLIMLLPSMIVARISPARVVRFE